MKRKLTILITQRTYHQIGYQKGKRNYTHEPFVAQILLLQLAHLRRREGLSPRCRCLWKTIIKIEEKNAQPPQFMFWSMPAPLLDMRTSFTAILQEEVTGSQDHQNIRMLLMRAIAPVKSIEEEQDDVFLAPDP